jgi:hypothetical protein
MKCELCGGLVTWRGPLSALTHTECHQCGGTNCQITDPEEAEDYEDYQNDTQAACGGLCQTPMEW